MQGASAANVYVVGLALLVDTVDSTRIGECMGYVSLAMSVGTLMGPILGGVVYETGGYYAVFGMIFGLIGNNFCLRVPMVEKKLAKEWLSQAPIVTDVTVPSKSSDEVVVDDGIVPPVEDVSSELRIQVEYSISVGSREASTSQREKLANAPRTDSRLPTILTLASSPRLLFTLWGAMVPTAVLSALDAVSRSKQSLFHITK